MTDTHPIERAHLEYPYQQEPTRSTDEELLAAVLNALHHHTGVPSDHIRAQVKGGHVTLSGIVSQDFEKTLAEQAVTTAPGVTEVINNITLET